MTIYVINYLLVCAHWALIYIKIDKIKVATFEFRVLIIADLLAVHSELFTPN